MAAVDVAVHVLWLLSGAVPVAQVLQDDEFEDEYVLEVQLVHDVAEEDDE